MSLSNVLKHVHAPWPPSSTQTVPVPHMETVNDGVADTRFAEAADAKLELEAELARLSEEIAAATRTRDALLADAQTQVDSMLELARAEAQEMKASANLAGYNEGLRTGREEANVELEVWKREESARLTTLAEDIAKQREQQLKSVQNLVQQFAITAVERLLQREMTMAPADMGSIVEELFTYLIQSTSIQVRVHPDDYATTRQAHPRWMMGGHGEWEILIVPDVNLSPGDCVILGDAARVDARISTRIAELQRELDELYREKGVAADDASS